MSIERIALSTDRAEWLSLRLPNVNASEMPVICGEGDWGSLAETFAEKKGLRPPRQDSGVLRRGRYAEAAAFEALADERPEWNIVRAKIYLHDIEHRIGATPDGLALAPGFDGPGVVQAKSIGRKRFRLKFLEDPDGPLDGPANLPAAIHIQVITEMEMAEAKWGVVIVLIMSGEYDWIPRLFHVEPDPFTWSRCLHNTEQFFRDYFDPGIMPPYEPQRDAALIKTLFPRDAGTTIDLREDNRIHAVVEELTETSAALSRLKKQEGALKAEITGKLGDNTYGLLADGRCLSWKLQHRRAYTAKAGDFRVLRVLKNKPDEDEDDDDE
jgi:hypothetical protein